MGGEWSGKAPICRYVDCGTPVRPDRGNIQLINGTTTVGSIVKYQVGSFVCLFPSELNETSKQSERKREKKMKQMMITMIYFGIVVRR